MNQKILNGLASSVLTLLLVFMEAIAYKIGFNLTFDMNDNFFFLVGAIQFVIIFLVLEILEFNRWKEMNF